MTCPFVIYTMTCPSEALSYYAIPAAVSWHSHTQNVGRDTTKRKMTTVNFEFLCESWSLRSPCYVLPPRFAQSPQYPRTTLVQIYLQSGLDLVLV